MMLDPKAADPFILLVHHRHSFLKLDPLRAMFRGIFMAEGLPDHPHRGFETGKEARQPFQCPSLAAAGF